MPQRYEIDLNGYHSPLDATEIAALFRAGAVRQNDPCRPVGQERWETVSQLFPQLQPSLPRPEPKAGRRDPFPRKFAT